MKHSIDTENFLLALLFSYNWDDSELDEGDCSICDLPETFKNQVDAFICGFDDHLEDESLKNDKLESAIESANNCERSYGGSVFWSLSGCGVGFWDESEDWGDIMQKELEKYAGGKYKFEDFMLWRDEEGSLWVDGITF